MRRPIVLTILVVLLVLAAGLMTGAMRDESATVDETGYLGAGYSFFKTGSYRLTEGHPILSQIIASFPMLFFDVHESPTATALMQGKAMVPYTPRWSGPIGSTRELFPGGPEFYQWALPETQLFGQMLVYDPVNPAEPMLFWGRLTQVVLTIVAGLVVFAWARQLFGNNAGLMAAVMWAMNPIVLAYGHLILTDMSITLMFAVTLWLFGRFLREPSLKRTLAVGVALGLSFTMKFTALSLIPACAVLSCVFWLREKPQPANGRAWPALLALRLIPMLLVGWAVVMIVYFPNWSPAPPIDPERALQLGVPGWFQSLRPILIPKDFFKGLALLVGHAREGGDSYLLGQWSKTGWWYYYFVALALKSPIPLLLLMATGGAWLVRRLPQASFERLVPWTGALVYLGFAMTGKIDIGIRHVLPIFPLLAVGVADQVAGAGRKWQIGAWVLCGWLTLASLFAYPFYIQYFNELAGGPNNGANLLIDSNFDWGQDAKRLKKLLEERGIQHIYLDYFGTQSSIEYLKIPNTRVNAEQAKQIVQGTLVVSASQLMRPEWVWLRESKQPVARVAYTLFVYQLTGQTAPVKQSS